MTGIRRLLPVGLVILSLLCWGTFEARGLQRNSATFDELVHFSCGVRYWKKHDYSHPIGHPPLGSLLMSAPFVLAGGKFPDESQVHPKNSAGDAFVYQVAQQLLKDNSDRFSTEQIVLMARLPIVVLSLVFLGVLFFGTNLIFCDAQGWSGAFALALAALSPTLLAHSGLATTDLIGGGSFFVACLCAHLFVLHSWGKRRLYYSALLGFGLALACVSKFSNLIILPIVFGLLWLKRREFRFDLRSWLIAGLSFYLVYVFSYQSFSPRIAVNDLLVFLNSFRFGGVSTTTVNYLFGHSYLGARFSYFPWAYLLKSTLTEIGAIFLILSFWSKSEKKISPFISIPPLVFFVLACLSSKQVGHRHVFAIYPFVWSLSGHFLSRALQFKRSFLRWISVPFLAVQAFEASHYSPFYLSYFNEVVPMMHLSEPPLADSNLDWGQGLIELREFMRREKVKTLYLSYFGGIDPIYYGVRYRAVAPVSVDLVTFFPFEPEGEEKVFFAISVNNWLGYAFRGPPPFLWLNHYDPVELVGRSILVYDFTGDKAAQNWLAGVSKISY